MGISGDDPFTTACCRGRMMHATTDETDLQLLHLLQIAPRVSWASAGEILALSPNACAARWARLRTAGLAWIAIYPNPIGSTHLTAIVDVDCRPQGRRPVIAALCRDPRVVSLDECGHGRDLLLTVMVPDLRQLSEFVLDDVAAIKGVTDTRTSIVTAIHSEGSNWRLDTLDPGQQRQAAAANELHTRKPNAISPTEHWSLIEALSVDGRISIAELARISDRNPATARRHLEQLLGSRVLSFRCDAAPDITGWPIQCSWLARVPPSDMNSAIARLRTLPQLRLCMSLTGAANLAFTVYSRTVDGLAHINRILGQYLPTMQLLETMVHLRTHKRMGWLLDADGRSTGQLIVPNVFAAATKLSQ